MKKPTRTHQLRIDHELWLVLKDLAKRHNCPMVHWLRHEFDVSFKDRRKGRAR